MMRGGKFVWLRGQRGPIPEKWPHDMPEGSKRDKVVLAEHSLSPDEFSLAIAILEQRYPPPKEPEPPTDPSPTPPQPSPPSKPAGSSAKVTEAA